MLTRTVGQFSRPLAFSSNGNPLHLITTSYPDEPHLLTCAGASCRAEDKIIVEKIPKMPFITSQRANFELKSNRASFFSLITLPKDEQCSVKEGFLLELQHSFEMAVWKLKPYSVKSSGTIENILQYHKQIKKFCQAVIDASYNANATRWDGIMSELTLLISTNNTFFCSLQFHYLHNQPLASQ